MTQKQIQYFNAVCDCGSVTKAAEDLFVSRPVISRALHELEEEIGAVLFIRTNSGLILTEPGQALHTLFEEFINSYTITIDRLRHLNKHHISRVLRVGITPTNGKRFFPEFYNDFHQEHPDIRLHVTEIPALDSHDSVINGDVDIFFTPVDIDSVSILGSMKMYESQFVFCAAASGSYVGKQSITFEEITSLPMASLYSPMPPAFELWNIVLNTSQQDLVRMTIANGAAYAVLPLDMVEDWPGVAAIPFDPCIKYCVRLIWNKAIPHNSAFEDFMSFISEYDLTKLDRTLKL